MAQTRHSREIAPPLKKQRADYTRPPRQREWFDDDDEDEDKERKRAATDFYTRYDECLLSMNPQSLAEIGGVKLHHDPYCEGAWGLSTDHYGVHVQVRSYVCNGRHPGHDRHTPGLCPAGDARGAAHPGPPARRRYPG